MEDLRENQKQEAIKRLKILEEVYQLHPNVLKEFKQDGTVYYSEQVNSMYRGILYWLRNKPKYVQAVKNVEEKYNIFVYHCILHYTEFGECLTMLYVSSTPEEWERDKNELKTGYIVAYVYNLDEIYSEFGSIEIAGANGGIVRVN